MRSPALICTCSKARYHAVLATLSGRYPPLEGRSPTRYSPVCHSTHPLRDFRVRLACIRHAASVDSEPGSNSHVKCVVHLHPCGRRQSNWFNASNVDELALRCSVRLVNRGSPPTPAPNCRPVVDSAAPRADSHCPTSLSGLRPRATSRRVVCACTHYLVFKEPTVARRRFRSGNTRPGKPRIGAAVFLPRLTYRHVADRL